MSSSGKLASSESSTVSESRALCRGDDARSPGRPRDLNLTVRRREEILLLAGTLFAERGYQNTDMQMIADRLGLSKGTIYTYFASKQEVFSSCVQFGMEKLAVAVDQRVALAETALEKISFAIEAYFEFFEEHPQLLELLIQERAQGSDSSYFRHQKEGLAPWIELFDQLKAQGIFRELSSEAAIDFVGNQVFGALFANYFSGRNSSGTLSLKSKTDEILDILFRGIMTAETGSKKWK